jgi:DNA polymerase IV
LLFWLDFFSAGWSGEMRPSGQVQGYKSCARSASCAGNNMRALCRECCEIINGSPAACELCGSARLVAHAEIEALTTAHIDCDAFYASVEKRDRPEIRDQPLIVGHAGGRGVVTTACYIARKFGVRSAMPMFKAMEACPQAVVLPPDMMKYKTVSLAIRDIFLAATDIIEPVSLDEAYLDLSEDHRHDGPTAASALAWISKRVVREVGITVSIGLAPNKFLAKLASEMQKPEGFSVVGQAEARSLLAPMSIRKINGVGPATASRMEAQGFTTIGDLQVLSPQDITARFGSFGKRLAQYAQGHDDRTVTPSRPTKSISAEDTFRKDISNEAQLVAEAALLSPKVAAALVRKGLAGQTIVLKLKTHDFKLSTRHLRLAHPTQRAELIQRAVATLLAREADGRFFRLIGVGVADLCAAQEADPPDLFRGARA